MITKQVKDRRYKNRQARWYQAWRIKEVRRLNKMKIHASFQSLLSTKHSEDPTVYPRALKRLEAAVAFNERLGEEVQFLLTPIYISKKDWEARQTLVRIS